MKNKTTIHPIIGLTGRARSGKDTFAARLVDNHGYTRVALADPVREAALALDPLIEEGWRLTEYVAAHGWEEAKAHPEVRRTLQRLGTEAGWMFHGEDLWTRRADAAIEAAGGPVVITDIRMPHETAWLKRRGGLLIEITRDGAGLAGGTGAHVSEAGAGAGDRIIDNDAGLDELRDRADDLMGEIARN